MQQTPGGWLAFLEGKLDEQILACKDPSDYYDGRQRLAFATAKFREAFARYFPPLANNWMKLVVSAPVSRLVIQGFRFEPDPSKPSWDQEIDNDAWAMWQASNLDTGSMQVHTEAVKLGVGYVLVSPPADGRRWPRLTPEHPTQCYVYSDPADRSNRIAAIKRWVDDVDGYAYATIYMPTVLYKWRSAEQYRAGAKVQWTRRVDDPVDNNPLGVVPLIPIENKPDMLYGGRSDLEEAIPIQDAVNKFCLDMQVSSEFHAYPQRYATGWERGTDDQGRELTGREVELLAGQSRLWRAENTETNFGQLSPGDVNNYIAPIELYIDHLAAMTQTPAYYLKGKMANLSADALHAADQGLVDRVKLKQPGLGDGWKEAMRVAFLAIGDQRGAADTIEVIWQDPETHSVAQVADALVKMRAGLSVPLEMCWQMLGWSPQQIQQAKAMMNLPASPAAAAVGTGIAPVAGEATLAPLSVHERVPSADSSNP